MRGPARSRARHRGTALARACRLAQALRRALQAHALAVWIGRLGQARMGRAECVGRSHRFDGRGRHQSFLGRALRPAARHERPLGQDVRQQPHGLVQGLGDDRAGVGRAPGGRPRAQSPSDRLCVDRRHVCIARCLRGRGGVACPPHNSFSRSPTALSFCRSTPTSTGAWRSCNAWPTRSSSTSPTR